MEIIIINELLKAGFNPDIKNKDGQTILEYRKLYHNKFFYHSNNNLEKCINDFKNNASQND